MVSLSEFRSSFLNKMTDILMPGRIEEFLFICETVYCLLADRLCSLQEMTVRTETM